MSSPFVRRRRLAFELRALREEHGMTAERLAKRVGISRMKISKLENAHVRPNLAEILKILDTLTVTGDRRDEIFRIARDAAEKGWWDYDDAVGPRQRLLAAVESGAETIREFAPFSIPGLLQTPGYIEFAVKMAQSEGEGADFSRTLEAKQRRQSELWGARGTSYEVVLDETLIRRPTAPTDVMLEQLRHLIDIATRHPRLTVRVLRLTADLTGVAPTSAFSLFTFQDHSDPPMAIVGTVVTDLVHDALDEVRKYTHRYEGLRDAALSAAGSLSLLSDAADELRIKIG